MEIIHYPLGILETNGFLLINEERGEAVLVDAPEGIAQCVAAVLEKRKLKLVALLLTHAHWDHIQDAAAIQKMGAKVYIQRDDKGWVEDPSIMTSVIGRGLHIEPVSPDGVLEGNETLELMGETIEVRHVPGHCPGNVLFYLPAHKVAFVGDAIFAGSVGRTDLPCASWKVLKKSILEQIYTLPKDTVLCPGHGPDTSVAQESTGNPYVRLG